MKISSHNIFSGPRGVVAVLLVVCLSVFVASPAFAQCKTHGRNKTPCINPLEGVDSYNTAQFSDQYVYMDGAQVFRRSGTSTLQSGDYIEQGVPSLVELATDDLSRASDSKRNAAMCGLLDTASVLDPGANGPLVSTPDEFSYGWSDDCTDGQCLVEVSLSFSGQDVLDLTGGQSDQLVVVMQTTVSSPVGQLEPFLSARKVSISSMLATYNRAGTSRPLVNCTFAPQGWGGPSLNTRPCSDASCTD